MEKGRKNSYHELLEQVNYMSAEITVPQEAPDPFIIEGVVVS